MGRPLPALAERNDPLHRPEGAALWPSRFPLAELERRREAIGSYEWLAQFQPRPVSDEDGTFGRRDDIYIRTNKSRFDRLY